MKKLSLLLGSALIAGSFVFTSCGGEEDVDPVIDTTVDCDSLVYPTTTGGAKVELLNFPAGAIEVEAGSDLSLAFNITRGDKRAQKLRLFTSDCINSIGNEYDLSKQEKGGKNGIDLRRTDDAQLRNVIYTVPSGFTTIYLTVEIDEADDLVTYEQLELTVTGSGVIDTHEDIELGGNSNALASRLSSATGQTYSACNAGENMEYIDVTYAVSLEAGNYSYISSNPARFLTPIALGNSKATGCGDDVDEISTAGGTATYFANVTDETVTFDGATDAELGALDVSSADNQYVRVDSPTISKELDSSNQLAAARTTADKQLIAFVNANGKKGLIQIESVNGINTTGGSVTVSVKVQR